MFRMPVVVTMAESVRASRVHLISLHASLLLLQRVCCVSSSLLVSLHAARATQFRMNFSEVLQGTMSRFKTRIYGATELLQEKVPI